MPTKKNISFFGLLVASSVCIAVTISNNNQVTLKTKAEFTTDTYANEYGKIYLTKINDSVVHSVFFNNEIEVFDTIMKIKKHFTLLPADGYPFLQLHTGGIKMYENRIQVFDFAGPAYMQTYTGIKEIYNRPFYKMNDTLTISDIVTHSKGGESIRGIYILPQTKLQNQFVTLTGILHKEKYTREYYSTADGPQGMFADTAQAHYRLVLSPISVKTIDSYNYTGYPMNVDGRAGIVWEYADSEIFYLEDKEAWTDEELKKQVSVEGILIQSEDGFSVIKNWKIIY